jgi:hypothetical protein
MYFCEKSHPSLPATCPTGGSNAPRLNCSEGLSSADQHVHNDATASHLLFTGEYGHALFASGQSGSRSYELDELSPIPRGDYCLRFFYYLSDNTSAGSINVLFEGSAPNRNQSVANISAYSGNKWTELRRDIRLSGTVDRVNLVECSGVRASPFVSLRRSFSSSNCSSRQSSTSRSP